MMPHRHRIVVCGVSGSGKSTIGALLATRLGCRFVDGDSLHPESNVAKMRSGHPLTDEDRAPWLARIGLALSAACSGGGSGGGEGDSPGLVVACSALKRSYRDALRESAGIGGVGGDDGVRFVMLNVSVDVLRRRVERRVANGSGSESGSGSGGEVHFMPASLLDSQLGIMEVQEDVVVVDNTSSTADVVVDTICDLLGAHSC